MKNPYPIILFAVVCMLAIPQARAVSGSWIVDNGGNWSDAAKWSTDPTVPGSTAGDVIDLTMNITANRTVTIDTAPRTVGILNISDGTGTANFKMVLAASGANYLTMDNGISEAQINVGASGSLQVANSTLITAPIQMTTGGLVVTTWGSNETIGSTISSASSGLKVLRVGSGSGQTFFSGVISDGSGQVRFLNDNSAALVFLSGSNTFTGGVTVQQGNVRGNNNKAFGTGTITLGTASDKAVGLNNSGNYTYDNHIVVSSLTTKTITIASTGTIAYTGTVDLQKALSVSNQVSTSTTFSGAISGSGSLAATANDATGRLILSGSNTYTGSTTVSAGSLVINGDSSAATGAVSVTNISAILGGSGTIGGAVTVSTNATLAAGGATTGILTVANDVTLLTTGNFSARINGATAGTGYDRLVLTGAGSDFSLTGTNDLKLTLGYTPAGSALFFLVDNNGGSAISGIFERLNSVTTDLSQGALFTLSGQDFYISYTGDRAGNTFTGGNDLVIQAAAIPEPATGLLLAVGLTTLAFLRRRRA